MTDQIIVLFPHADGGRPEWPGFWAVTSHEDIASIPAADGKVSRLRSNFVNGIKHMPVRY